MVWIIARNNFNKINRQRKQNFLRIYFVIDSQHRHRILGNHMARTARDKFEASL